MKHKLLFRQVKKHLDGMKNIHPDLEISLQRQIAPTNNLTGTIFYWNVR
jgi:hypothetical protein